MLAPLTGVPLLLLYTLPILLVMLPWPCCCCVLSLQDLRSKLSRAEAILKLSGMCRKLETEQEKVLPFHNLSEAVPVPEQPHLAQWDQQQQQEQQQDQARDQDQHEQQDQQQQLLTGQLQDLQVSICQQQWEQGGKCSQPASPSLGLQQQQQPQQQWCAVGLDDSGQPVSDWAYLNRWVWCGAYVPGLSAASKVHTFCGCACTQTHNCSVTATHAT
jgi:hypothetical protein